MVIDADREQLDDETCSDERPAYDAFRRTAESW